MNEEEEISYSQFEIRTFTYNKHWFQIRDESFSSDDLVIILHVNSIYAQLCSLKELKQPISHNCPNIIFPAHTLEQYYQQFKVYKHELDMTEKIPKLNLKKANMTRQQKMNEQFKRYNPSQEFYENISNNLLTSKLANYYKKYSSQRFTQPIYWAYFNPTTHDIEKMTIQKAKYIYVKIYEQLVVKEHIFKLIHEQIQMNKNMKVIIYSGGAYSHTSKFLNQEQLKKFYDEPNTDFSDCYCLLELLVHYPNLNNVFWNKKESTNNN